MSMPPVYAFDFTKLTIGDLLGLLIAMQTNDTLRVFTLADPYVTGGALKRPWTEMHGLAMQFATAFIEHLNAHTQALETTPDVARLLRSALGEEASDGTT